MLALQAGPYCTIVLKVSNTTDCESHTFSDTDPRDRLVITALLAILTIGEELSELQRVASTNSCRYQCRTCRRSTDNANNSQARLNVRVGRTANRDARPYCNEDQLRQSSVWCTYLYICFIYFVYF